MECGGAPGERGGFTLAHRPESQESQVGAMQAQVSGCLARGPQSRAATVHRNIFIPQFSSYAYEQLIGEQSREQGTRAQPAG